METQPQLGIDDIIGSSRTTVLALAEQYGFVNVRVFGSVARGEATAQSDIDILVDVVKTPTLVTLSGFRLDLMDLLKRRVDVSIASQLKPYIRPLVLRDAVPL